MYKLNKYIFDIELFRYITLYVYIYIYMSQMYVLYTYIIYMLFRFVAGSIAYVLYMHAYIGTYVCCYLCHTCIYAT